MSHADPADFTAVVSRFLYTTLKNDSDLVTIGCKGVSNRQLPQVNTASERSSLYPRILFYQDVAYKPSFGGGGHIRWQLLRYVVVGIGFAQQEKIIEPISARILNLLHMFSGEVAGGGFINSCAYDGPVNEIQSTGEDSFLRIGSRFRIKARLSNSL